MGKPIAFFDTRSWFVFNCKRLMNTVCLRCCFYLFCRTWNIRKVRKGQTPIIYSQLAAQCAQVRLARLKTDSSLQGVSVGFIRSDQWFLIPYRVLLINSCVYFVAKRKNQQTRNKQTPDEKSWADYLPAKSSFHSTNSPFAVKSFLGKQTHPSLGGRFLSPNSAGIG